MPLQPGRARTIGGAVGAAVAAAGLIGGWIGHHPWWWIVGVLLALATLAAAFGGEPHRRRGRVVIGGFVVVGAVVTAVAVNVGTKAPVEIIEATPPTMTSGDRSVSIRPGGVLVLTIGSSEHRLIEFGRPRLVPEGPIAVVVEDDETHTVSAVRTNGTVAWERPGVEVLAADASGTVAVSVNSTKVAAYEANGELRWSTTFGAILSTRNTISDVQRDDWSIQQVDHVVPRFLAVRPLRGDGVDILSPTQEVKGTIPSVGAYADLVAVGDRIVWADVRNGCRVHVWRLGAEQLDVSVKDPCSEPLVVRADGRVAYAGASATLIRRVDLDTGDVTERRSTETTRYVASPSGLLALVDSNVELIDPADGLDGWQRTFPSLRSASSDNDRGSVLVQTAPVRPGPFGGRVQETRSIDSSTGRDI